MRKNKVNHLYRCDNTIGSYACVRVATCGTGYTLSRNTGMCVDDDECRYKSYIMDKSKSVRLKKNLKHRHKVIISFFCYRLGSHNCDTLGPLYKCRNTKGSFRCEKLRCGYGKILNEEEGR